MSRNPQRIRVMRPLDDPAAEYIAWLMDSSIKIGPVSFGLDGLIGLIPGLGDIVTNLFSAWIIIRAMQNGAHRAAILRMVLNLGIDTALGAVPIAGDIFDLAYKANTKNLRIYRESLSGDRQPLRDWGFIALVVLLLIAMIILPILGMIYLVKLIIS